MRGRIIFLLDDFIAVILKISLIFFNKIQSGSTIEDLYEDLRDGFKLLSLLQNLSGQSLVSRHDRKVRETENKTGVTGVLQSNHTPRESLLLIKWWSTITSILNREVAPIN